MSAKTVLRQLANELEEADRVKNALVQLLRECEYAVARYEDGHISTNELAQRIKGAVYRLTPELVNDVWEFPNQGDYSDYASYYRSDA